MPVYLDVPVPGRLTIRIRRAYRRWLAPRLSPIRQQRLKLVWYGWGYWRLITVTTVPVRTRLRWLRAFLRVDWHVQHAHTPAEIVTLARLLSERPASRGELVVEAGCWQGGSTAKISRICADLGYRLHVFDSFAGVETGPVQEGEHDFSGEYASAEAAVRDHIRCFGDLAVCTFHSGWFVDTLAAHPLTAPVRLVYIDCDLAKGTREVLAGTVPSLVRDGYVCSQDCHIASVRNILTDVTTWQAFDKPMPEFRPHSRRLVSLRFN